MHTRGLTLNRWSHVSKKLRAGSEDRRGAQPPHTAGGNTTRGETPHHKGETAHGETHPPTTSLMPTPTPTPFCPYMLNIYSHRVNSYMTAVTYIFKFTVFIKQAGHEHVNRIS